MSAQPHSIRLRIVCMNPPDDAMPFRFGLQDKQGELQPAKPRADGALLYECDVKASRNQKGNPNFTGGYTHGTPDERFLYISVRQAYGSSWLKRSKIMLGGITWEMVEAAVTTSTPIEIMVDGIAAGRAKVVQGWQVTEG